MYKDDIVLKNIAGLNARPASVFAREASKYLSEIKLIKDGKKYNAKSVMGVLSMGALKGDLIEIQAQGEDAKKAVTGLINILNHMEIEE